MWTSPQTLAGYLQWVNNGTIDPTDTINYYINKSKEDSLNCYARIENEYLSQHREGFSDKRLKWAPIAVKDNFLVQWTITSCGAEMLRDFVSPYTSTVIKKLEEAWWLMIAKANMDDSAMGSSTESCVFWEVLNPHDPTRIPWWSSWWSAAAVAADLCIAALWTDTAGSVRQPAAMCGVVWMKPTYWRTSRYGIQAMASSLDQAWVITKTVEDAVILLDTISWVDKHDAMTVNHEQDNSQRYDALKSADLTGLKCALPKEFLNKGLDDRIKKQLMSTIEILRAWWAIVEEIDLPIVSYWVATYYILCPAEVSTNLARFDGVRFGVQDDTSAYESIDEYYASMRHDGFGPEIVRRIMLGSYVLSAGHYDAYYTKAQRVRAKLIQDSKKVFEDYDAIIWPTSPVLPRKLGNKMKDPVQMYLADIYTVLANLIWIPAISIPMWKVKDEEVMLPTWFQIMTKHRDEKTLFQIAQYVEKNR